MSNCSLTLKKETLPKVIAKVDYFMFRAMERNNIDVFQMTGKDKDKYIRALLTDVKPDNSDRPDLLSVKSVIIPEYIADYVQKSKDLALEGDTEQAQLFKKAAENLESMLTMWDQVLANYIKFTSAFKIRNKFVTAEDGMVDLAGLENEETMLKKMVFDVPANEIDPIDDIDAAVELFIKSIPDKENFDDYGYTSLVNYSNFVRGLLVDVENSVNLDELQRKIAAKVEEKPAYQYILDKLIHKEDHTRNEFQFRINFRNSFAKAFMPIYMVSLEDKGIIKVFEAATGKKSGYERVIESNFFRVGVPVMLDGKEINLAHEVDGGWQMDKTDVNKILDYLDSAPGPELRGRQMSFLKGLGFEFSPQTEEKLIKSTWLGDKQTTPVNYIKDHLIAVLNNLEAGKFVTNPIRKIKQDVSVWKKVYDEKEKKDKNKLVVISKGQNNIIGAIIDAELKFNKTFNMDRNMVTAEGNRMNALQLHNNFTTINKFLSDPVAYPKLENILAEPSMAWLNPVTNPSIRSSMFLNSLFYFDPNGENYGERRRVTKDKNSNLIFSATEGEYVTLKLVNTGGLQVKSEDETKGSSSTDLNDLDKLLQDINGFRQNGYNSMLRLGDKSTDLGISLNYYNDPTSIAPQKKPLGFAEHYDAKIFSSDGFHSSFMGHLQDYMQVRYLATKGFLQDLTVSSENVLNTWGYFEDILSTDMKAGLDKMITEATNVNDVVLADPELSSVIKAEAGVYFENYSKRFIDKFANAKKMGTFGLLVLNAKKGETFDGAIKNYLANSFLMDLDQMKVFFGDPVFFKAFHKRAPKDSATGLFTTMDENTLQHLNNLSNPQGYGAYTNLSAKRLVERLAQTGVINQKEQSAYLDRQRIEKSYRSAVLNDVKFKSSYATRIIENVEKLKAGGFVTPAMQKLFDNELKEVISNGYKGVEADGQGKCTFDFYRVMSIMTGKWSPEQEAVYKKIIDYSHFDELATAEKDPAKRVAYIEQRDKVGYNPLEEVYFPPKKFQYAGPMGYEKTIDNGAYNMYIPIFDKFSLQPLIPTMIKDTADEHLAKKMELGGIGYVKFVSATKTESPLEQQNYYETYNENDPEARTVNPFIRLDRSELNGKTDEERKALLNSMELKGGQTLYFNHLKEQVSIEAEIHESTIFGSQIRKLIMMNLAERPEFKQYYNDYKQYLGELVEIEKASLYNELGIDRLPGGKLKVNDMNKLVDYFMKEIGKKNQDSNVKRVLNYNETTGEFDTPLDGAVQAQVIEGIIISAINNKIVKYKANGSMLVQVAITGSEKIKYSSQTSKRALETFGNSELKYYNVEGEGKDASVTAMQVKIGLSGKWKNLLYLKDNDGRVIETLPRLNEMLKNEQWKKAHRNEIRMVAYRIPTQGRNFLDVMEVAEFLPAQFGDAIIMPSEVVIKSGSDFDIDKMFVLYPNLGWNGEYVDQPYTKEDLSNPEKYEQNKKIVQNRLFKVMSDVILHPANYMELITPSSNYHTMPVVDDIYQKVYQTKKAKTDYKNSEILDRDKNIRKYLSLLKGKSDLGIAAVANTFNVLFQHAGANINPAFFAQKNLFTNFTSPFIKFADKTNRPEGIDMSSIYDEDGALKSEFFSEFINAFVDVANDDYVFAVNVVTELSPIMFYMKYTGLSTKKIMYFMNQPVIRAYIKKLMGYDNKFLKNKLGDQSARNKALQELYSELGYRAEENQNYSRPSVVSALARNMKQAGLTFNELRDYYKPDQLLSQVRPDDMGLSKLSQKELAVQFSYLVELENLKVQSDSMTEAQRALNFDTNTYHSSFDVYGRNQAYLDALQSNVLSKETIANIKKESIVSPLDVAADIAFLQSELFPVRNDIKFNKFLLEKVNILKNDFTNKEVNNQGDMLKFARVAKNDYVNYILQNHFEKSEQGKAFFKKEFDTDLSLNDYLKNMVLSNDMIDQFNKLKKMDLYGPLTEQFPFINNIIFERAEGNPKLFSFRILENSSNVIEKESVIAQFELLANLEDEDLKPVRKFFRDMALYSVFQSGLNTSTISYTNVVPIDLINPLYGYAINEFKKVQDKDREYNKFYSLFLNNNPGFFGYKAISTTVNERSSKGKWYAAGNPLLWAPAVKPQPVQQSAEAAINPKNVTVAASIPQNKVSGLESFGSLVTANDKVISVLGDRAHSIDMIEQGLRTRTTRSATELQNYAVKVGDIVKHFGTAADGTTKNIYTRVTAIHSQGSLGWKGTWEKEGWSAKDVDVIDRFLPGAAAIEFELLKPTQTAKSETVTGKPKGEMIKEGIYINQAALSKEEQLELFNYLKPYLEEQAAKTNKGAAASKMIGLGLRWDYKSNNPGQQAVNIPDVINPGNKDKYGYYTTSINGQPLAAISSRFKELMQKATGVDMANYDGAIINLYDNESFISSHNDVDESRSAIKYPVIGINIGGTGNFSIESRDGNPKQLNLKAGSGYIFGVDGVNRDVFHRTFPGKQDSFLPALTTKIDGKTYEPGSYRITITMRRIMPLKQGMAVSPGIASTTVAPTSQFIGHSGGAGGADMAWDAEGKPYGVTFKHYYTGVKSNKNAPGGNVDISNFPVAAEGAGKVALAAKEMWGYKYNTMKDERLIRNWAQVVKSDAVFALAPIGKKGDVWSEDRGKTDPRILLKSEAVQGGTGYAVEMAIQAGKKVYVYNDPNTKAQSHLPRGWYIWNGSKFEAIDAPVLTKNFAGIGSRNISNEARQAIRDVYTKTFGAKPAKSSDISSNFGTPSSPQAIIEAFFKDMSIAPTTEPAAILSMYNKERLDDESLNEFLTRKFCKGKI